MVCVVDETEAAARERLGLVENKDVHLFRRLVVVEVEVVVVVMVVKCFFFVGYQSPSVPRTSDSSHCFVLRVLPPALARRCLLFFL